MPDPDVGESLSRPLDLADAARIAGAAVLQQLGSGEHGLSSAEARRRLDAVGPNAVRTHRAGAWTVLGRQLRSPILILLLLTAALSAFLGDATNSIVIGIILMVSVGLGFGNEFRAERAAEALHSRVTHRAVVIRDGGAREIDVTALVPGDIVRLGLGAVVPADIRLLAAQNLQCDESILTGESMPAGKDPEQVHGGTALGDLSGCVFMGTVVQSGNCTGVVVATGRRAEFGRIALGLGERQPETEFQRGLKHFSFLLLQVAVVLTSFIFVANLLLQRPIIESLLFSLAIAVGITPQLLPAVVSTSLATGTRRLAKRGVLVKRLVCIEDLGDIDLLVTDKTGTLTEGQISFATALPVGTDMSAGQLFTQGLLATEADYSAVPVSVSGLSPLDAALWDSPGAGAFDPSRYERVGTIDFDHLRRRTTVLVRDGGTVRVVTKGAPEDILELCVDTPAGIRQMLDELFDAGSRVVAVAGRPAEGLLELTPEAERDLVLSGFLVFLDQPKSNARESLEKLAALGITVKVATGDNPRVAERVCKDLGVLSGGTITGAEMDQINDTELSPRVRAASIFARVSPEQKARIIRLLRQDGGAVGFLGDGVNDALALHAADIGISVDSATDVAKDSADIVLLDKDLGVLADGVVEGRRIFANTIKYVLMGTSSNFGNMVSAATASVVLSFLPMLPRQILLNNLLYDSGQLAIPGDRVDEEQLLAPSHWNIAFIRRFMIVFGPISSLFDFATFALMLLVFNAAPGEFRAGWFIESVATQTLIIFVIRTRRIPFFRSRPSAGLLGAAFGVIGLGVFLPLSPLAGILGFDPLPVPFFLALLGMAVVYLVLVESAKHWFFSREAQQQRSAIPPRAETRRRDHHIGRRAARFSVPTAAPRLTARGRGWFATHKPGT